MKLNRRLSTTFLLCAMPFFLCARAFADGLSSQDISYDLQWANMQSAVTRTRCTRCWEIGLLGGVGLSSKSDSATVVNNTGNPAPGNQDVYQQNKDKISGLVGAFVGYRWLEHRTWFPGIILRALFQANFLNEVSGSVTLQSDPTLNDYSFKMPINSYVFSLFGKFNVVRMGHFSPFVSAAIGFSLNDVGKYSETAKQGVMYPRISPGFTSNLSFDLSYAVGGGIDYFYSYISTITLGYQFLFLGKAASGKGVGTWSNASLHFGDIENHIVYLAMTYAFH